MTKLTFPPVSKPGRPVPLGARVEGNGVQFSLLSRNADSVSLVLFLEKTPKSEYITVPLDPARNRTGDIWHIWIEGAAEGQQYGYKIGGRYKPAEGHRFNPERLIIDPYARALTDNFRWDLSKVRDLDGPAEIDDPVYHVPRAIVIDASDLPDDRQLQLSPEETIIYEMHVKGFTRHPSSGAEYPGTYRGVIEKIPYLKELGVTAVELLPVQEFDEYDNIFHNPFTGERLKNYWGYNTIAFFAPKATYSSTEAMGLQIIEFREMVKALHDEGIEVILDVVFNHTGEGDERGPVISFKGIDNSIYYMLEEDKSRYKNFSGCGNTFNCNHPLVREFILDCLKYWVIEMKVDGFRFDLASILGRDINGNILSNPPLIERIEDDPILRNTKLIAEAWDAAGAYQVGKFPSRWQEWNGMYRDDVRSFWRGDADIAGRFATRLCGSSDLYGMGGRGPCRSINFITCHDGFTLNDLVSYEKKHNEANGEDNRDGENHNISRNYGAEGPTDDSQINSIRLRQMKNFIATLFLSQGIPMLLMGDEFMRTKRGNNNTYCQDSEYSWLDWSGREKAAEFFEFTQFMIRFRREHPSLRKRDFFTGRINPGCEAADISWHGPEPDKPDWSPESRFVALLVNGNCAVSDNPDSDIYMVFNANDKPADIALPASICGGPWKLAFDTSKPLTLSDNHQSYSEYCINAMTTSVFTAVKM